MRTNIVVVRYILATPWWAEPTLVSLPEYLISYQMFTESGEAGPTRCTQMQFRRSDSRILFILSG